jgi:hypothetical protein
MTNFVVKTNEKQTMTKKVLSGKDNTNGFQKNPENINVNGRPRKLISDVVNDLKKDGITPASKADIVECYLQLIQLPMSELKTRVEAADQPAMVRIVGKAILGGKGFEVIEKVLDRSIGKAEQNMKVEGEINTNTILFQNVSKQFKDADQ